jgi:hypothetical protein
VDEATVANRDCNWLAGDEKSTDYLLFIVVNSDMMTHYQCEITV